MDPTTAGTGGPRSVSKNAAKSRLWVPQTTEAEFHQPPLRQMAAEGLQGLIICGGCLTVSEQDTLPLGSPGFCSQWLSDKAAHLQRLCLQLSQLPKLTQDEEAGLQAALCLLRAAVPARVRHLRAAITWNDQQGFNAALQSMTDRCYKDTSPMGALIPG